MTERNTAIKTNNAGLKKKYSGVYPDGIRTFYSFETSEETDRIYASAKWAGKTVLEIGCGEGVLASRIADAGAARVIGIDFTPEAIETAKQIKRPNLEFKCCDYRDLHVDHVFDIVVMEGVLEHVDDPLDTLNYIHTELLTRPGTIVSSSPGFLNPRGWIWMTLQCLFDIPMSLTDLHFLGPMDYQRFAEQLGSSIDYTSVDQDWGHGRRLIEDFDKRLRNALSDKGMDGDVDRLLDYIGTTLPWHTRNQFIGGATVVYTMGFSA